MRSSSWAAMKRLGPFLQPYFVRLAQALAALAAVHLVEALAPLLLKLGVERMAAGDGDLALPVGGILALTALRYGLLSYGRRRNASVSVDLAADLRIALFAHVQRQGAYFFSRYALGDLMARASNDVDAVRMFFRSAVNQIVSLGVVIVVAPIFMFSQSPELTAVVIALSGVLVAVAVSLASVIRRQSAAVQAQFAALSETIRRNLQGVRTIQAHGAETREIARFSQHADAYARANVALLRSYALHGGALTAAASASALLVAGVGGAQVLQGHIGLGTLIAFIFYSGMILGVLGNSGPPVFHFLRASTACARLFQVLDEAPEIRDGGGPRRPKIAGAIAVENLAFRYPNGSTALKSLSFAIAPGELIAIHGRVGAGKTTLLRLLARRLEASGGAIRIDGTEIRDFPLPQLRREVVFVTQDSFLFAASFGENISYDDPERAEESIWDAAGAAALAATIRRAPEGLATPIGERGVTLSGGQKQRTALARGLIRAAPVLLLDDCFSALDAETEAHIFAQIRRLRRGLTTLVVSHRVSTTQHADRVFMLDENGVAESGAPEALRAAGGQYAELCAQQGSRFAETGAMAP